MKLTKEQWEKILSIVLGAALAVFAVLGWVITPTPVAVQMTAQPSTPAEGGGPVSTGGDITVDMEGAMSYGLTGYGGNFDNIYATSLTAEDVTLTDDLVVGDDFSLTGDLEIDGALDVDGNVTSDTGGVTVTDQLVVGVDGTSYDVTLFSDTAGDYLLWDESEEALTIIGTDGQDALNVDDGNVDIADNLDVDGSTNVDAIQIDGQAVVGADGTSFDVIWYSDTAGDYLMWDESEEALTIIGTDSQDALNVDDGNVDIADDIDVDGTANLDNTDIDGTLDVDGNISSTTGGVTVTDQFIVGVDGTSYDVTLFSDTEGDYLLWDESEEALTIIGTNGQDALNVDDGNVDIDDDLDVDGTTNLDNTDIDGTLDVDGNISSTTGGVTVTDQFIVGVDGTSYDFTLFSDTEGDYLLWDESEEALTIIGTNGQDALNIDDGNVDIADDIDVDGTSNLDEVDIDGVLNLVVGTAHIGVPSVIAVPITYTAATGGSGVVATIGDGHIWFIHDILVRVTAEFTATAGDDETLIIGDGNDTDGFLVLDHTDLTTTYNEGVTGHAAGWLGKIEANVGVYFDPDGTDGFHNNTFVYAPSGAAETIDWAVACTADDCTGGAATIYVIYTRIQ